jgi:predicted regulator of Ras-like GTPase activity (Roadblock/LC7/MglB family)
VSQSAYSLNYPKKQQMEVKVMDKEVYSFALKNTLNEIQNVCPDVTNSFMFKEDGEIIAGDENTPQKTMAHVVDAFDGILEKAETIGGLEGITLKGDNGRVNVSHINDLYLVTVTSRKADMNYVNTITRVLVPTILKLLEKLPSTPLKNDSPTPKIEPEFPIVKKFEEPVEESTEETVIEEPKETVEPKIEPEPYLPEPQVNQLIVENLGGLLVPSDTVRIDSEILSQWEELYSDRKIGEVEIGTFDGKTTRCKVKPIKGSKYEGKGIIQMPEKMQLDLEIKKGELVRVKPIVE